VPDVAKEDAAVDQLRLEATQRQLARISYWMDERFRIPGTSLRVGLDGLLGLIPGVGDAASGLIALGVLAQARRLGAPRRLLVRMLGNVLLDTAVGSIPLVGDLFDFAFKANRRNLDLLMRHLDDQRTST
jgi:hypothetical protein